MLYKYQYSQHSCWVSFEEVEHSYSHHQRTDQFLIEKHCLINQSVSPRDLPEGLFAKMNFSKVLSNLKILFSIALNLVSRFSPLAATDIGGSGFILAIPDVEEITVVVIVEEREE